MIWDGWFTRFKRRKHEKAFTATLKEIKHFKQLVEQQTCLGCEQQSVKLMNFKHNPHGWEADVSCKNCNTRGMVNIEGYDFVNIHSKGKAVDKK